MKIRYFAALLFVVALFANRAVAQEKYITKKGHVYFMSHTDAIDIDANNYQVACILDTQTGEMVFKVLIKAFKFTLATAEEHFNETYMESDKYPTAAYKAKITNLAEVNFKKDGTYTAKLEGDMTLHGVTNKRQDVGTITVKGGKISANANFKIAIDDYQIKVPKLVADRVAKIVDCKINLSFDPYAAN